MAFTEIPGFIGKVFVPDDESGKKKHKCRDCFVCQMCSDEKCEACLKSHCKAKREMPDSAACGNE